MLRAAGLRTGDDLQVNGAAVRAGRVAGSADVLPRHALGEVAQPQGAVSLICGASARSNTQFCTLIWPLERRGLARRGEAASQSWLLHGD